jgi:hypothetical protein
MKKCRYLLSDLVASTHLFLKAGYLNKNDTAFLEKVVL